MTRKYPVAAQFLLGIAGLASITFVCFKIGFGLSRTAFLHLILITLVSLLGSFRTSVVLSIFAVACLNYFFVPPLFEFRVDDPDDIVRMAVFLTTSLVVTANDQVARERGALPHFRGPRHRRFLSAGCSIASSGRQPPGLRQSGLQAGRIDRHAPAGF
jgi:K+-sensing histidine kinase KdpD